MRKRRAIIIITVVMVIVSITIAIIVKKNSNKRSDIPEIDDTIVTTCSTNSISEEEMSAMVSEMVESQLAQRLSEETTLAEVTTTTAETTVPQHPESSGTTAETPNEETQVSSSDTDISAIVNHNGKEYSLRLAGSEYQAAFQSRFLSETGREISVSFDTKNISRISVATAFVDSEELLSDFGGFTEIEFTLDETGTSFSYTIPDNPNADVGYYSTINFCAVFRVETRDGVIYTAISY